MPDGDDRPDGTVTWAELLTEAERRFADAGFPSPAVDARRIVEHAGGFEPAELHAGLAELVTVRGMARFDTAVGRRLTGEPLQYVIGAWSFRTLDLYVDRRVLIPRPETEVVAEVALGELDRLVPVHGRDLVAVDLGTGSGAIGLSIAAERPHVSVIATDVSSASLAVARANTAALGSAATRVELREGSWFEALPAERRAGVHLVVSNPPYVGESEELPAEVADWEPVGALRSGPDGCAALRHLLDEARSWLTRPGALVLELAPAQADALADLARSLRYAEVEVRPDLTGRARALVARLAPDISAHP